jgi:hypothetical protein
MTFFARPNLSEEQFKQLSGTVLPLSGQTQIATISGLTLHNNSIGTTYPNILITAEGADSHVGDVLTYDGLGRICLRPAAGGSGDPIYPLTCKSPAAITLGGVTAGSPLAGCTLSHILETLLVPTLNPTLTAPSSTFSVPLSSPYEVGTIVNAIGTTVLNRGCINPQYTSTSPFRSCGAISHNYVDFNGGTCTCSVLGTCLTKCYIMPPYTVVAGVRTAYGSVTYCAGVQPKDSSGSDYSTPLGVGTTTPVPATICGMYPYFYGKVASGGAPAGGNRPTATCALIIAGTKVVADSTGTISINWNSTPDDYIWFATPTASQTKTKWADTVVVVNNGNIGGSPSPGGNLFPNYDSVNSVATVCWAGQTYKVYISNYQTQATNLIALTNS